MEILREITEEELNYVIRRLEENLPYAIKDLYYILAAKRSKSLEKKFTNISDKILPVFYVPRNGRKENCTIFGINTGRDHTVWFFTFEESIQELTDCLEKTKLIRWSEKVLFVTIHREHTNPIFDQIKIKNSNLCSNDEVSYYTLAKEEALKFQLKLVEIDLN
jgi:hypothetical protein